jgi:hypothetical protein
MNKKIFLYILLVINAHSIVIFSLENLKQSTRSFFNSAVETSKKFFNNTPIQIFTTVGGPTGLGLLIYRKLPRKKYQDRNNILNDTKITKPTHKKKTFSVKNGFDIIENIENKEGYIITIEEIINEIKNKEDESNFKNNIRNKKFQMNNTDLKKYLILVLKSIGLNMINDNIVKIDKDKVLSYLQNIIDNRNKYHEKETLYIKKLKEIKKKIERRLEINQDRIDYFLFNDLKDDIKKSINSIQSNTFEEFFLLININMVELTGIEPVTLRMPFVRSTN